jgi:predicted N-formylglutamate amidohydrolase
LVVDGWKIEMSVAFELIGEPKRGGILVVSDHASNHVPDDVKLGIDKEQLQRHIAWDIGVRDAARYMVELSGFAAFIGAHSRLVADLNRYPEDASAIPISSDGVMIPGNQLNAEQREERLSRYFHPYHQALEDLLSRAQPALIISLHSFTPRLETSPSEKRPWEIGVLYNQYEIASQIGMDFLESEGLQIGDQLPYSGKLLNATMNRHAEAHDIPYIGIEIRQDLISNPVGQERFAAILAEMGQYIVEKLASDGH